MTLGGLEVGTSGDCNVAKVQSWRVAVVYWTSDFSCLRRLNQFYSFTLIIKKLSITEHKFNNNHECAKIKIIYIEIPQRMISCKMSAIMFFYFFCYSYMSYIFCSIEVILFVL